MKCGLLIAFLLCCGTASAAAPQIRVEFDGKPPYYVGAQISVIVRVLAPNYFLSQPRLPNLDIPGAVVTLNEGSTSNFTTTIDGTTYAGITQTFLIVPQRAGDFALPLVPIAFRYAAVPGQSTEGKVTLPAKTFTVVLPAGARPEDAAQPAARVTIVQTLDRDVAGLEVGDTLTRTVDAFAEHTQAMLIPPPTFDAPKGVRVYAKAPVLTDETKDRVGFVGGRRVDRVVYRFDAPGDYTLPAVEIAWFDTKSSKRQFSRGEAISVSVAPNAAFKPALATEVPDVPVAPEPSRWREVLWAIGTLMAAGALVWLLRRVTRWFGAWRTARRKRAELSEAADFARVERACRSNDAAGAYAALIAWAHRAESVRSVASLSTQDSPIGRAMASLEQRLFGKTSADNAWDGRTLLDALSDWRSARPALRTPARRSTALPKLNP